MDGSGWLTVKEIGNGSETSDYLYIFLVWTYEPYCMFKKLIKKEKNSKM